MTVVVVNVVVSTVDTMERMGKRRLFSVTLKANLAGNTSSTDPATPQTPFYSTLPPTGANYTRWKWSQRMDATTVF